MFSEQGITHMLKQQTDSAIRQNSNGKILCQTGRMIPICKVCCCFVAVAICVLSYLMRIPDQVRIIYKC